MFIVFQLPLTDVRPFIDGATGRVPEPVWPLVHLPDDPFRKPYVRGFGSAQRRLSGGVDDWPGEDYFCDLSHAVRFPTAVLRGRFPAGRRGIRRYCRFRRLFWDGQFQREGSVVGRVEMGFGLRLGAAEEPLGSTELGEILDALLAQPLRVLGRGAQDATAPRVVTTTLNRCGSAVADAYLRASTGLPALQLIDGHGWWVQAGTPMLVVEAVQGHDVDAFPGGTRALESLGTAAPRGIRVFHGNRKLEGRERPVWYFESSPGSHDRDALRRLRLNVTRLHAVLGSLRLLSDLQVRGRLAPTTDAARARLKICLSGYLPYLYQRQYMGFESSPFLRAALSMVEELTPAMFASLRALHPAPGRGLSAQLDRAAEAIDRVRPSVPEPAEWDIFIAHAGADVHTAEQLFDAIGARARVFLDSRCLLLGDDWDLVLPGAQRRSAMTVVLVGDGADQAFYLRSEIAAAINMARVDGQRHRVVPVYLEGGIGRGGAEPYGLNLKHGIEMGDGVGWAQVADRIVDTLKRSRAATSP